jgi:hypothetical protein
MRYPAFIGAIAAAVLLAACNGGGAAQPPVKNTQSQKAKEAANSIQFSENAEIDNIKKRLELTSQPGLLGFIVLLNEAGQPIMYEGVIGKVTSGGKRLTPTYQVVRNWDCGEWGCDKELPAPSDEGTFGSSGEYVFYWNTEGAYRQWSGKYLYSDKPLRLRVEPLVVTVDPVK